MSKYNFRKVGGRKYLSWKKWEENDNIIARYIKPYEDQFGHTCHEVEILEADLSSDEIELKEGDTFGVNYCGSIDYKLKEACKGDIIQITYEGMDTVDKGPMKGKDFHVVDIQIDDTNRDLSSAESEEDPEEHDL